MDSVENIIRTVSETTYMQFVEWAPQMMEDQKLRSLFFGLLNGSHHIKKFDIVEEGRVLATCEWIAFQVNEHEAYINKNHRRFTAIGYLQKLQAVLPAGWNLEWSDHNYQKKLARTALLTLPNYVYELLNEDLIQKEKPRRYLRSGKQWTKNQQTQLYASLKEVEAEQLVQCKHYMQRGILDYLHRRSPREFDQPQLEEALVITQSLRPLAAYTTRIKLANILEYLKPIYHPVEGCYRLYSGSLQYLPSKVRYALFPNMLDIDLKSCHVSIISSILNLDKTMDLLKSGKPFWSYLINNINAVIDGEIDSQIELKPILKQAIYSICFGAGKRRVKNDFKASLESNLSEKQISLYWKAFEQVDVVVELLDGTSSWRKKMLKDGYCIDPFGVKHSITDSQSARRACFNYCSALELKLIYPVYELAIQEEAKDKPRFKILLHSHDGVTIKLLRPKHYNASQTLSELKSVVDAEAMKLNIPTTLEFKGWLTDQTTAVTTSAWNARTVQTSVK